MDSARRSAWSLLAVSALLSWGGAVADTFTNKKTGETVKGRLLGTVSRDGQAVLFVKTEAGKLLYLPKAEWVVKGDPGTPAPGPSDRSEPSGILYLGKRRTEEWVDEQYAAFRGKFTVMDGQLVDVSNPERWQETVEVGEACQIRGTVMRVLEPSDCLVRLYQQSVKLPSRFAGTFWSSEVPDVKSATAQVVRLKGAVVPGGDDEVACRVAAVGTCEVEGKSVVVCQRLPHAPTAPVTREQFLLALQAGLPLSTWEPCFVLKRYKQVVLNPEKRLDPRKKPDGPNVAVELVLSRERTVRDEVYCSGWRRRGVE